MAGLKSLVGYEAGERYIKLTKQLGLDSKDESKQLIAKIENDIKTLKTKPRGPITPIIFRTDRARPLKELVSHKKVDFDLDGDLRVEKSSWVTGETCMLAWDPQATGKIKNGRQLFGSVTWWIFFDNGYRALDALDDNRDGWLKDSELKGIVVWRDRNTNGKSDAGEVVSLRSLGIEAISVKATGKEDGCPCNRTGLKRSDGRVLPTYDWIST